MIGSVDHIYYWTRDLDAAGHGRFATFRDPDGNAIQIIEYTPAP